MHSVVVDQVDDTLLATMSGLTDGDFYASPGWIRYEGVDPDSTQRFALVFDDHELVAAAPLYVVDHEASRRYSPRTVLLDAPTDRRCWSETDVGTPPSSPWWMTTGARTRSPPWSPRWTPWRATWRTGSRGGCTCGKPTSGTSAW